MHCSENVAIVTDDNQMSWLAEPPDCGRGSPSLPDCQFKSLYSSGRFWEARRFFLPHLFGPFLLLTAACFQLQNLRAKLDFSASAWPPCCVRHLPVFSLDQLWFEKEKWNKILKKSDCLWYVAVLESFPYKRNEVFFFLHKWRNKSVIWQRKKNTSQKFYFNKLIVLYNFPPLTFSKLWYVENRAPPTPPHHSPQPGCLHCCQSLSTQPINSPSPFVLCLPLLIPSIHIHY